MVKDQETKDQISTNNKEIKVKVNFRESFPHRPSLHALDDDKKYGSHTSTEIDAIFDHRRDNVVLFTDGKPGGYANIEQLIHRHFRDQSALGSLPPGQRTDIPGRSIIIVASDREGHPDIFKHTTNLVQNMAKTRGFEFVDHPEFPSCLYSEQGKCVIVPGVSHGSGDDESSLKDTGKILDRLIASPCVFRLESTATVPAAMDQDIVGQHVKAIIHADAIQLMPEDATLDADDASLVAHRLGVNARADIDSFDTLLQTSRRSKIPYIFASWETAGGGAHLVPVPSWQSEFRSFKHEDDQTKLGFDDMFRESDERDAAARKLHPDDIARLDSAMRGSMRDTLLTASQALACLSQMHGQTMAVQMKEIQEAARRKVYGSEAISPDLQSKINTWAGPAVEASSFSEELCGLDKVFDVKDGIETAHNPIIAYSGDSVSRIWNSTAPFLAYVPITLDRSGETSVRLKPAHDVTCTTYLAAARPGRSDHFVATSDDPTVLFHNARSNLTDESRPFLDMDKAKEWRMFCKVMSDILTQSLSLVRANQDEYLNDVQRGSIVEDIEKVQDRIRDGKMTDECESFYWDEGLEW